MPPPVPPSVYAGRTSTGYLPIISTACFASSIEPTVLLFGIGSSSDSIVLLNSSLSSERAMAFVFVPRSSTPSLSSVPLSESSEHRFRAVCPPIPARIPSTFSFSRILLMMSAFNGSTYTKSAVSTSVWIVAGLELANTVMYPSSRRDLHACDPEKSNSAACPMTIGPEPITISFLMSVRFGIRRPPSASRTRRKEKSCRADRVLLRDGTALRIWAVQHASSPRRCRR